MSWIPIYTTFPSHRKRKRLSRLLGASCSQTIGCLVQLWLYAMEHAQAGNLADLADDEIAAEAGWDGDPAAFVDALTDAGFLSPDRTIHDWDEYGGRFIARRERDRVRKAAGIPVREEEMRLEKKRVEKKDRTRVRASRIPDDFSLTPSMLEYARQKGVGESEARRVTEEFVLYWQSASKNAEKINWEKAWQLNLLHQIGRGSVKMDAKVVDLKDSERW